jgi:hypothetical protein
MSEKNIQIPVSLFNDIFNLLECLDVNIDELDVKDLYDNVLDRMLKKQVSIALRGHYGDFVRADDDKQKSAALSLYIQTKSYLKT